MNSALSELKISEFKQTQNQSSFADAENSDLKLSESKLEETVRNLLNNVNYCSSSTNCFQIGPEEERTDVSKFDDIMEELLGELICKELLADPISELANKVHINSILRIHLLLYVLQFPLWADDYITKHPHDEEKIHRQIEIVTTIDKFFKDPKYSKNEIEYKKKIFSLLQELQGLGPMPEELMIDAGFVGTGTDDKLDGCIQM